MEEIQQSWHLLTSRVARLEAEKGAIEHENKALRALLERVIEHRQKSHTELVLLLTGLVSKLPINDVGVIVSKLVEHSRNVNQSLAVFGKGGTEADLPQPELLKTLEQTKRDLAAALKPAIEELLRLDTPLETEMLQALLAQPELFFSPKMVRANRCFVKAQLPRERIVKEFGEEALVFFNDMTTDPKLNPRPKSEEIALAFKPDFDAFFQQNPLLVPNKRQELAGLYQKIQSSRTASDQARAQKQAFQKLSFMAELLHFYEHQDVESPEPVFAQRLPTLIEQLGLSGLQDSLDEKLLVLAEGLLAFVISPENRQMIINNIGKGGGTAKTLKYVLRLRAEKSPQNPPEQDIADFVKHLIPAPPEKAPTPESLAAILRLVAPDMQRFVVRAIMSTDRLRKDQAETLGKAVASALDLKGLAQPAAAALSPEAERQMAWARIKELIASRGDASAIAAAIRERLNAKYNADEIRESWIALIEADAMSLIRTFCQIPYRPDGKTDSIAQPVMETYVTRLTHEKYAGTYQKIVKSLKNMFAAKPDSPTLVNFMALVKLLNPEEASKWSADIGMPVK